MISVTTPVEIEAIPVGTLLSATRATERSGAGRRAGPSSETLLAIGGVLLRPVAKSAESNPRATAGADARTELPTVVDAAGCTDD
ncbi:MAG: hypothetical protein DWH74_02635, partial [Planctomycetota bacterium]